MKKLILVIVTLLSGMLAAGAQELTIPQIREEWPKASLEVPQVKGRIGIAEFAQAFTSVYKGNDLTDEIKAQLDNPGRVNEDVYEFILDRQNGYCALQFVSDGTVRMEMCFWNLKDGWKLVAVNMFNVYEDKDALLMLYKYNPDSERLEPDLDNSFYDMDAPFSTFLLPREGKDIETWIYHTTSPSALRYDGEGGFILEANIIPAIPCFIVDDSPTNIRRSPGGEILFTLSPDDDYMLDVYDASDGWWRILAECVTTVEGDEIELSEDGSEAWVHYSVLGIGIRNYDGTSEPLYESPSKTSKVVGKIEEAEALVRPVDMAGDASWVKVKWGKLTGWIESDRLCANPVTTCP